MLRAYCSWCWSIKAYKMIDTPRLIRPKEAIMDNQNNHTNKKSNSVMSHQNTTNKNKIG